MINLILGAPGGGKSYEATVYHVLPALRAGRKVITNLALNVPFIESVIPNASGLIQVVERSKDNPLPFSTISDFSDPWRHPESGIGALYVIDECHKPFPKQGTKREVQEWFAESRHELADVLLISQSYRKLDTSICDLVQLVYRVRKNIALGSSNSYVRKVQDGIRGEVVNTSVRTYDPKNFPFYNSHTRSDNSAQEAYASDVKPIWFHWSFIGAAIFLVIALYLIFTGKLNFMPEPKIQKSSSVQPLRAVSTGSGFVAKSLQDANPPIVPPPSAKAEKEDVIKGSPFESVALHISGFITNGTRTLYSLAASQNGQTVFFLNSDDLIQAGYSIKSLGSCSLQLSFGTSSQYLTCDSPRVGVSVGSNLPNIGG